MHGADKYRDKAAVKRALKSKKLQEQRVIADREAHECPTPHKHPYMSRRMARVRRNRTAGEKLGVYLCMCGAYHLGKLIGTREQAREFGEQKLGR